ncbi:MAG TPA: M1 family peptidase, partial [Flavobacteriia bacterium]|nr:M1 family peptidase [Flavobacteriia bacterium]
MKKISLLLLLFMFVFTVKAQDQADYKGEKTKINDLVHTKLKVNFDFKNRQMPGEAWVTLKPHFYPTNTLTLDAKAMKINSVKKDGKDLKYDYDGKQLKIKLGNTFAKDEKYTIYINYVARPEEIKSEGSAAITDEKGLYFIDPDGTNPDRPTEIWTQGETESSSVWFPTIDSPNQKTTEEIYMTVPSKFKTLSNGLLVSQIENGDGTRTDYWKMDLPHAPYLFFMGVGDFAIVKDTYKGKEVNYYVDHEYEPYAREIFGKTPKMIDFFSTITGVEYPWQKYDQMVGYDYVSGAMENTTAVLHSTSAYQTSGQLIDANRWEDVIAHELFHHWFGDYVTAESWANLTVNESFANYSEYLWREHEYGKDHAGALRHKDLQGYFMGGNEKKPLVRFHYNNEMDMFDAVSYNKGGYILHMLRNILGDKAFFAGLNKYLTDNKFGTGEAQKLRIALEEVSGRDLNWFFDQWYFDSGNPKYDLKYNYDAAKKQATITVKQTGKVFKMPVKIAVYDGEKPKIYTVWVDKEEETFGFNVDNAPKLIDFDTTKSIVSKVSDNKTDANYVFQYDNAPSYENRREAIEKMGDKTSPEAINLLKKALNDPYFGFRIMALNKIDLSKEEYKGLTNKVKNLIANDPKTLVQAAAIKAYAKVATPKDLPMFDKLMNSKSYAVKTAALNTIYKLDAKKGLDFAKQITDKTEKENMKNALIAIFIKEKDASEMPYVAKYILNGMFMNPDKDAQMMYGIALQNLMTSDNIEAAKVFIDDAVSKGIQYKQY